MSFKPWFALQKRTCICFPCRDDGKTERSWQIRSEKDKRLLVAVKYQARRGRGNESPSGGEYRSLLWSSGPQVDRVAPLVLQMSKVKAALLLKELTHVFSAMWELSSASFTLFPDICLFPCLAPSFSSTSEPFPWLLPYPITHNPCMIFPLYLFGVFLIPAECRQYSWDNRGWLVG